MCGITGIFPLNTQCDLDEPTRRKLMMWFNTELLHHTISRGKDATGITVSYSDESDDPSYLVLRQPDDANDFFANDGSDSKYSTQVEGHDPIHVHHKILDNPDRFNFIIGHTRKKTKGSAQNMNNNHPIITKNIIGIQNGGVDNDDEIFKLHPEMERKGEVDSEAVIQLFAVDSNEKALDWDSINFVTQRMEGDRAVMAYNSQHPETVAFFRNHARPIEMYYLEELGAILICSLTIYMTEVKRAYNRLRITCPNFPKMTYRPVNIQARDGGIIDVRKEYDGKSDLKNFLQVKTYNDTIIQEYKESKSGWTQIGAGSGTGSNMAGQKKSTGSSTTPTQPKSGTTGGSQGSQHNTGPSANANGAAAGPANGTTEIEDLSNYDSVDLELIMDDDKDDDNSEIIEPEELVEDIFGMYSEDEIRAESFSLIADEDYFAKEDTIFNRDKNFKKFFDISPPPTIPEMDKVMKNIYPEVHADGFVAGTKWSESFALGEIGDHTTGSEALQKKADSATRMIANMKVFIMALLKAKGVVDGVEVNEESCMIYFSPELDDILDEAAKNCKLNINSVLDTFTTSDFMQIRNNKKQHA